MSASRTSLKVRPSDLWRWDGTIDRAPYFFWGAILLITKYLLDIEISKLIFHRSWSLLEYFAPGAGLTFAQLTASDFTFYGTMLAISLPFAWTGSVLTVRRLRAAQLPAWLVILFYLPVANLIFFKVLTWLPTHTEPHELKLVDTAKESETQEKGDRPPAIETKPAKHDLAVPRKGQDLSAFPPGDRLSIYEHGRAAGLSTILDRIVPYDATTAFWVAALLPLPAAVLLGAFGVFVLGQYGMGVFIAIPFMMSIIAPILYGYREPRGLGECISVSIVSLLIVCSVLLLIPFEGIICLMMAAPFAIVIGFLGACLGYAIQRHLPREPRLPKIIAGIIILIPFLMLGEHVLQTDSPTYKVTTTINVNASPETVWNHVVSFSELKPPQEWYFKTGIAYPIRASINGQGKGAVRHCEFSTGPFVEPITVWDEPRLLKFSVTGQPAPMNEMSPYRGLHPRHLDGYLQSLGGQFVLVRLPGNTTRLEGTTWYQNHMEPSVYWRLWADGIIHAIHSRVLAHVKQLSEVPQEASSSSVSH